MSDEPRPPAGWYPVGDSERYWDGIAWTDQVRAPGPPSATSPAVDVYGFSHASPGRSWPPPDPAAIRGPWGQPGAGAARTSLPYPQPSPMQYGGAPYGYVVAKNPGVSLLASFFVPGLGSMLNGDVGKGIGILVGYLVSWLLVIILIGFVGLLGFWIWGMVDAYQGARLWNARHGIVS